MPARRDGPTYTEAPADGVPVVLYDGHCQFCTTQAKRLRDMTGGRIALRSFQDNGVLDDYPGLTHEACMEEMKLIASGGRVYGGAEAFVRAVRIGRPVAGTVLLGYYLPGVRWIADRAYAWVARRRYRIVKRRGDPCETGSCHRHVP